jgi:acetoin:2,6-dichlorophenolindophenol oxidoreductase subunit beta
MSDSTRILKGYEAIHEGLDQSLALDDSVYVIGLGAPDPKGIFGTTVGLQDKYGSERVMDMPASENGMTGIAIGSALAGMKPVMIHQRVDFVALAMEQIVNQASNWNYMFGGQGGVPLVIRLVVGRGWGQGPQHSQSLQSWFAHVPGLKVVMPAVPADSKGLLVAAIDDPNPVIILEHRWTHGVNGDVSEARTPTPIGKAAVLRSGSDVTLAGVSFMALESLRAAELLAEIGVSAEVIDIRSLRPLDTETIVNSVRKTGRFVVGDTGWKSYGVSAEISSTVVEQAFSELTAAPVRIALPDVPSPTSPALTAAYYPGGYEIAVAAAKLVGADHSQIAAVQADSPHDVPDASFTGPF